MATRSTTKKSVTSASTPQKTTAAKAKAVDETVGVVDKKPVKEKKVFSQEDRIPCRSVITGGLYMEGSKTKYLYEWSGYGDVVDVEYRDLVPVVRDRTIFAFGPWFIVEDDDFVKEFPNLKKFYDESYSIKDLKLIINLPVGDMVAEIKSLPKTAVESLKSITSEMISDGSLDSVKKIKALDELFGTDLQLIAKMVAK